MPPSRRYLEESDEKYWNEMEQNETKSILSIVKSFEKQFDDEISVEIGQIVQKIRKLDKYWFEIYIDGEIGKIPIDCCREIKTDQLRSLRINTELKQAIYVSKHDFVDNCEQGDLRFSRFELIVGFYPINNDWWYGTRLNSVKIYRLDRLVVDDDDCGIFPLTFVWQLRNDLLPAILLDSQSIQLKSLVDCDDEISKDKLESDSKENQLPASSVIDAKPVMEIIDQNDKAKHDPQYLFYVKVNKVMEAQLEEEINLPEIGEILGVEQVQDKLYYFGRSLQRNVEGIFPQSFVTKIANNEEINKVASSGHQNSTQSEKYTRLHRFEYQSFDDGVDNADDHQSNDLPPSYESVTNSIAPKQEPITSYGYANSMFDNEMVPYGRALYDFDALNDSELSLRKNQIVKLIRHYDQDWIEGEINGRVGFFPRTYISIIVDCKDNNLNESIQSVQNLDQDSRDASRKNDGDINYNGGGGGDTNQIVAIDYPPNTQAKVLFDFDGEMEQDLRIKSGDLITLLRKFTSTDWIEAQDSCGNIGFVHLDLCEPLRLEHKWSNLTAKIDCDDNLTESSRNDTNSLYPNLQTNTGDEDRSKSSSESDEKKGQKPIRRAPLAPRRNNVFPTFNQFTLQEKQEELSITDHSNNINTRNDGIDDRDKSTIDHRKNQREFVIKEFLQTEKDYFHSLNVCYQVFNSSCYEAEKVDCNVEKLVGDMKMIIDVSKRLIKSLESYATNRPFIDQRIGICFLDLKFEINASYTKYCRNHCAVTALLKYYEKNSFTQSYIKNCLGRIQEQINCFDLSSIWIKPVQRILKYPLLLNELIKYTEPDHVDYELLKKAIQMITDIASCINEHKRRQDLIQKYCHSKEPSLAEKFKNFSMHSFKKKSTRLKYRIWSTLSLSSGTKDKDYDTALSQFREIEKSIRFFIKDLREYIETLDGYYIQSMISIESISEYLDLKRNPRFDIDKIREQYRKIYQIHFKKFSETIDSNVLKRLNCLLGKFSNPLKLISKRDDKRIDYESSLKSKNDQLTLIAKNNFEALNQQLIDELPILSEVSLKILFNCVEILLIENKKLIGVIAKLQLELHSLPLVNNWTFGILRPQMGNFDHYLIYSISFPSDRILSRY
ncbi:Dynamin-binding protein [Sarcoptes scabiei]|uniref:Dynamin-binding protein n=1 Tax=Sarcoptes scabiei TaxID=52283 RepID=A0A834RC74_SARSC|nr:Dynamin-binding protein [Sarcoptes scabiei]